MGSKLLYSATMSLDGFIAGVDGDMSWLAESLVKSSPAPIMLGDGVRLFDQPGGTRVRLEPIDPAAQGPMRLWFRVLR